MALAETPDDLFTVACDRVRGCASHLRRRRRDLAARHHGQDAARQLLESAAAVLHDLAARAEHEGGHAA